MMNTEETLLITPVDHYDAIINDDEIKEGDITTSSELKHLTISTLPLVLAFLLQYVFSITSVYSAGQLGAKELAACSLAICTFNITGLAIFQGMATSLDTFCSQAYGSGNKTMVGIYFQRGSLLMLMVMVPLTILWWFSGSVLKFLVPDPELVSMTQFFLRIHILGVPGLIFFESGKRFLQAQHIFQASTYILMVTFPVNLVLNWWLVWNDETSIGYMGVPVAIAITYWIIALLMLLYVIFIDGMECWGGIEWEKACSNWKPMLSLAIPGVVMVISDFLAFEILTIFASRFGTEALAAQSIVSNIATLCFQVPFAFAVAISTRMGHLIGDENISGAKVVNGLTVIIGGTIGVASFMLMYFGRKVLASFFTNDEKVLTIASSLLFLAGINQISDALNVVGTGVLRGQGRQRIGSILNIISYYFLAIPLGYVLAFKLNMEMSGLWIGLIIGVMTLAIAQCTAICLSNWTKIVEHSHRIHDSV
ncbi:putative transporter [Candida tropicalis]